MVRMDIQAYKPYWRTRTYSKQEFIDAWNTSRSIAACARKLNLVIYGSTYMTLKNTAKSLNLSDEHMLGQGWNKPEQPDNRFGKHNGSKRPIEYYLVENGQMSSSSLKERLLKEGLLEPKCSAPHCPNPITTIDGLTGEEKPTPLTLDHINGINNDNRLENLRLLCANCDRFNPTFCRGSKRNTQKKVKETFIKREGLDLCACGGKKYYTSIRCRTCHNRYLNDQDRVGFIHKTKIEWPTDEKLLQMVKETSFLATGKSLGVSDTAVRKRLKNRGII